MTQPAALFNLLNEFQPTFVAGANTWTEQNGKHPSKGSKTLGLQDRNAQTVLFEFYSILGIAFIFQYSSRFYVWNTNSLSSSRKIYLFNYTRDTAR